MNEFAEPVSFFRLILKNAFSNLGIRIIGVLMAFGLNLYMAPYYGAGGMGSLVLLIALVEVGALLVKCGFNISLVKWIPEHLTNYSFASAATIFRKCFLIILWVGLALGILIFFTSDIINNTFFKGDISRLGFIRLAAILILISACTDYFKDSLRGLKKINQSSLLENILPVSIQWISLAILTYWFFEKNNPLYSYIIALFISGIAGLFFLKKFFEKSNSNEKIFHQSSLLLFKNALPFYIIALAQIILLYSDSLILGFFRNEKEVGLFNISFRVAGYTSFMLAAMNTIAAPVFSELYHAGKMEELRTTVQKTARFTAWISLPVYIIILSWGKNVLSLFGEEFVPAYFPLVCVATGQFINAYSGSVGNLLMMTSHHNAVRNIHIVSALLNIVLSFLLVPHYGINGSAVSTMISVIVANVLSTWVVRKKFGYYIFLGSGNS